MTFHRKLSILIAAAPAFLAAAPLASQTPPSLPLTLGDAARLAARQNASAEIARLHATEAGARVRQREADLFPNLSSYIQQAGRTFNSSTLGIDFPPLPGQKPLFDPRGQVIGPIT